MRILLPWYKYPPFGEGGLGGLSVAIWELTHELVKGGVRVDVLAPQNSDNEEIVDIDGVSVISSPIGTKLLRNRALPKGEESRLFDEYDTIFSVNNYAARTLHNSVRLVERVLRQVHSLAHDRPLDSYVSMKPSLAEFAKAAYFRYKEKQGEKLLRETRTLCVSRYLEAKVLHHAVAIPERTFLVPNGIDTAKFKPSDQEKRYDLLFIGRFQKAKGLDLLLNSLQLLRTKGRKYTLGIVGKFGSHHQQYLITKYCKGMEDSLTFLGAVAREELPNTMTSARILVAPSRYEAFGLPSLEAIASGVPVIASNAGGLPEIIDDSVGRIFANGSEEALAKTIYDSQSDSGLFDQAATRGPAKARNYDWKVVVGQIIRLLREPAKKN